MKPLNFITKMSIILSSLIFATMSYSADFEFNKDNDVLISGAIQVGDAEKLAKMMIERDFKRPFIIVLSSNGGDISEAIKMAYLIRGTNSDTWVKFGGQCVSACFIMWISGKLRWATGIDEYVDKEESMYLGIHRPYLSNAKNSIKDNGQLQRNVMNSLKTYLIGNNVPIYIVDKMMELPSNEVYWLQREDLFRIGEFSVETQEIMISECKYNRNSPMMTKYGLSYYAECYRNLHKKHFNGISEAFIKKLRTGWRPWNE